MGDPKNTWLFTADWGVDSAVSAPALMTWLLERAVGVQEWSPCSGPSAAAGSPWSS